MLFMWCFLRFLLMFFFYIPLVCLDVEMLMFVHTKIIKMFKSNDRRDVQKFVQIQQQKKRGFLSAEISLAVW